LHFLLAREENAMHYGDSRLVSLRSSTPAKLDVKNHPCFNVDVYRRAARVHLPVAPRCNLQCNYCDRSFDCANESRPGVSSALLSPFQALAYLKAVYERMPHLTVVGIAGPGDPFANSVETIETLRLVRRDFPNLLLCVATNGLGLVEHIDELVELKVSHITLTMNTIDPAVGARIYRWVRMGDHIYRGADGAELLLARQREALDKLRQTPILVKVNTIVIPGVNEGEVGAVAAEVKAMGAEIMNTMAMVPVAGTPFESLGAPPPEMVEQARALAGAELPQMAHCARCRADACGLVGETAEGLPDPRAFALLPRKPDKERPYVAVASREGMLVNQHVGEAEELHVFAEKDGTFVPIAVRRAPEAGSGVKRWLDLAEILHDCRALLTTGVGSAPRRVLTERGVEIVEMEGLIDEGLTAVFGGKAIPAPLRRTFHGCGLGCGGGGGGCG
jgi:nitrogen fixation protein NifB